MWIDDASDLRAGDVIGQRFGADRPPIARIEWLDSDRARLHHDDGTTSRVRVQDGAIRLVSRAA